MRKDTPTQHRCLAAGDKTRDPLCSSNRQETKSEWEQVCQWDSESPPATHPPPRPAFIGLTCRWHSYTVTNMAAEALRNLWNLTLTAKAETCITQTLRHSSRLNLYSTSTATPVKYESSSASKLIFQPFTTHHGARDCHQSLVTISNPRYFFFLV